VWLRIFQLCVSLENPEIIDQLSLSSTAYSRGPRLPAGEMQISFSEVQNRQLAKTFVWDDEKEEPR
jgi:hypothetical protein